MNPLLVLLVFSAFIAGQFLGNVAYMRWGKHSPRNSHPDPAVRQMLKDHYDE